MRYGDYPTDVQIYFYENTAGRDAPGRELIVANLDGLNGLPSKAGYLSLSTRITNKMPITMATKPRKPPTIHETTEKTGTPKNTTTATPSQTLHIDVNHDIATRLPDGPSRRTSPCMSGTSTAVGSARSHSRRARLPHARLHRSGQRPDTRRRSGPSWLGRYRTAAERRRSRVVCDASCSVYHGGVSG